MNGVLMMEDRMNSLELLVLGREGMKYGVNLGDRVEALQRRVEEVCEGMPRLNEGISQCLDLEKMLHRKRTSILQVGEKIQFLLGMKDDLLKSFQLLDNVKTLERAADGLSFHGRPSCSMFTSRRFLENPANLLPLTAPLPPQRTTNCRPG